MPNLSKESYGFVRFFAGFCKKNQTKDNLGVKKPPFWDVIAQKNHKTLRVCKFSFGFKITAGKTTPFLKIRFKKTAIPNLKLDNLLFECGSEYKGCSQSAA